MAHRSTAQNADRLLAIGMVAETVRSLHALFATFTRPSTKLARLALRLLPNSTRLALRWRWDERRRRWRATGAIEEQRLRDLSDQILSAVVDRVVRSLCQRAATHMLADDVIHYLRESPELPPLIDDIVRHLAEQPAVVDLIREQGAGLSDQLLGEVRERLGHADALVDRSVDSVRNRLRHGGTSPSPATPARPSR